MTVSPFCFGLRVQNNSKFELNGAFFWKGTKSPHLFACHGLVHVILVIWDVWSENVFTLLPPHCTVWQYMITSYTCCLSLNNVLVLPA